MNLMSTARALDDQDLYWRVKAACILKAKEFPAMAVGGPKNYGLTVLLGPHNVDASMLALVAADPAVSGAVTVTDGAVDTSPVTDAQITAAVEANWDLVGNKYPASPLK